MRFLGFGCSDEPNITFLTDSQPCPPHYHISVSQSEIIGVRRSADIRSRTWI